MSFILDALRKSDAERQRAAAPGLADVRYALRRSRRNIWLPILVVVLAANMVFMGVQWFGRGSEKPATVPAVAANPAPAAATRPLAREAEFGEPLLEPEGEIELAPEALPAPQPEPLPEPATVATGTGTPSRILENTDLPSAEQLIGTGGLNIPLLNLDLHVYSEKAANRFVVISARKYKEGGQLTEGPTVESITKDGVILAYQGQRFTLSRR